MHIVASCRTWKILLTFGLLRKQPKAFVNEVCLSVYLSSVTFLVLNPRVRVWSKLRNCRSPEKYRLTKFMRHNDLYEGRVLKSWLVLNILISMIIPGVRETIKIGMLNCIQSCLRSIFTFCFILFLFCPPLSWLVFANVDSLEKEIAMGMYLPSCYGLHLDSKILRSWLVSGPACSVLCK